LRHDAAATQDADMNDMTLNLADEATVLRL
jgi:hypothetical protein